MYNEATFGKHDLQLGGRETNCHDARPYLVLVFDAAKVVFMNIHHCNGHNLQNGFDKDIWSELESNAGHRNLSAYRFIFAGDFNDRSSQLGKKIVFPAKTLRYREAEGTCCTAELGTQKLLRPGDFVFDSATTPTIRIPASYDASRPQSDHRPVEVVLSPTASASSCPSCFEWLKGRY